MLSMEKQILYMLLYRHAIATSEFIHIYKDLGKNEQVIRNTLSSLKKKGYIFADDRKYALTEAGASVIRELQLKFSGRDMAWDGKWHFVMFSIPERYRSRRNSFRREMAQIGYGLLYDGVFVCPHNRESPVREIVKQNGLDRWIRTVSGQFEHGPITAEQAKQIWPLESINTKYDQFMTWADSKMKKWTGYQETLTEFSPWDVLLQILELGEAFGEILLEDPFIPKDLLPDDWRMQQARDLYHQHIERLIPLLKGDSELISLIAPKV